MTIKERSKRYKYAQQHKENRENSGLAKVCFIIPESEREHFLALADNARAAHKLKRVEDAMGQQ